jgi:hypothetical protein
MRIRRVDFWDFFHEADNAAPTAKWTNVDGTWSITTRKLRGAHNGGGAVGTCYLTSGTGGKQNARLRYGIKFTPVATTAGWWAAYIIQASAQAGRYLGNSIVVTIDASNVTVYTSAANVLTQRGQVVHAHATGTTYRMLIDLDPVTGNMFIYEDDNLSDERPEATTSILTVATISGYPFSGRTEIGLACHDVDMDHEYFQVQSPDFVTVVHNPTPKKPTIEWHRYLMKRPGRYRFHMGMNEDATEGTDPTVVVGDHIEIIIYDGSVNHREFFGQIEDLKRDTADGMVRVTGRDPTNQMVVQEGDYTTGGAMAQGTQIVNLIDNCTDDLPSIDVKAGGNNYDIDFKGRNTWEAVRSVARQMGYSFWYSKDRKLKATDTYVASGITIDNDDDVVLDAVEAKDLYDLVNTIHVYYDGGDELRTDATSQGLYGKRGGPHVGNVLLNKASTVAAVAQEEGDGYKDHYKDPVQAVRVNVVDYHELDVGETVTLNLDNLGIAAASALVVEKHYDDRYPWLTFGCIIFTVNPLLRLQRDATETMFEGRRLSADASAWQA